MRARVRARRQSQGLPAGFWQRLMGQQPSAARLRRWLFLALLLALLALYLIRLPADFSAILALLFSARTFGHLLALFIAFWLALRAASGAQFAIFDLPSQRAAQSHLLRSAFGFAGPQHSLGEEGHDARASRKTLQSLGGPAQLQLHMEEAAITETSDGAPRVIAPTEGAALLDSFERLRTTLDLRDQVLNLNFWARTRDGIRVHVQGARLVYSIARGQQEPSLRAPYPFSKQAALRIVKSQRVAGAERLSALGAHGAHFFEHQLQAFIGEFWLGELLAAPKTQTLEQGEDSAVLFLARDAIRERFMAQCRRQAFEIGLQLHWIDIGTWKVDELAQEILQDYQEERGHELAPLPGDPFQESRAEELKRLFGELTKFEHEDEAPENGHQLHAQMLGAYHGLFDGLKLRYGAALGSDEGRLDVLLRFLKVMAKRLEKRSN